MKMVNEFVEGDHVNTQLLVVSCLKGVTNNGLSYLNLELRDSSGSVNAKKWEVTSEDEQLFLPGNIINVVGEIIMYKSSLQMKVFSASVVKDDEIDASRFMKTSPIKQEELIERFNRYINSIKNKDCHILVQSLVKKFQDRLYVYPAAVSIHHDYRYGLLTHIVSMCDIGHFLCNMYVDVNEDLLISGIILHDIGKTIELEGNFVYQYSLEGKLIGHISIMVSEIRQMAERLGIKSEVPLLLEHMVLSHHGQYEFGSPILPMTQEAMLLSLIDALDSKMVCLNKAYENISHGEFTQKLFAFDGRIFYKPKI